MRTTLLLVILMGLVSCVSKTEKSSTCTYNGEPCQENIEEPVTPTPTPTLKPTGETVLHVSVKSYITHKPYEIEILENSINSLEFNWNGVDHVCEASTESASILTYKIADGYLTTMEEKRDGSLIIRIYEREGEGKKVMGKWIYVANYRNWTETTRLEITEDEMKIRVECRFKKAV